MNLKAQVLADPACAAAYAARDCHELARILSSTRTKTVSVPLGDIQARLQSSGAWWAIKPIAVDPAHPANAAAVAVTDVAHARYENLDTSLPIVAQMFGALVLAGAMAQADVDAIMAMSRAPDPIGFREVAIALFNDDGSAL